MRVPFIICILAMTGRLCPSFLFWKQKQTIPLSSWRTYGRYCSIQGDRVATKRKQLPARYWKDHSNQKSFLLELEEKLNIREPNDWYKVKWKDFQQHGGKGLLKEHDSLHSILTLHFPDIEWDILAFSWKPKSFWDDPKHQRLFFDFIAKKYNIKTQKDWQKVGYSIVQKEGGTSLMRRFGSFIEALKSIYPEREWEHKVARKLNPRGYWSSLDTQRKQLDKIKEMKGIKDHSDWKLITASEFRSFEGGVAILSRYDSYYHMLRTIYPEYDWNIFTDVPSVSRNYWKSKANQKAFMEEMAQKMNLTSKEDWFGVTLDDFRKHGGSQLLRIYGTKLEILRAVYPEIYWASIERFDDCRIPSWYFDDIKNQRKFLDFVGRKLGVRGITEWNKITRRQIEQNNGRSLLAKYSSMVEMLKNVFPEHKWKATDRKTVPHAYWKNQQNQREFLDDFAKKFDIKEPQDWSKISYNDIVKAGGGRLLRNYVSLYDALQTLYPEHDWDATMVRTRVPNKYWDDMKNVREFVESLAKTMEIKENSEWERVSIEQVSKLPGGRTLIFKYGNLHGILKAVYPNIKWKKKAFQSRNKRAAQRVMFLNVQKLFPGYEVIEEYLHEDLSRISGRSIELDTFIPELNIAFEFQGQHHYLESPSLGSLDLYKQRDSEKVSLCHQQGIHLVCVPYWWDGTITSLKTLICQGAPTFQFP